MTIERARRATETRIVQMAQKRTNLKRALTESTNRISSLLIRLESDVSASLKDTTWLEAGPTERPER